MSEESEKQPLVSGPQVPSAPLRDPPPAYSTQEGAVYSPPHQESTTTVLVNERPPNYLVQSVLSIIFCCWIFGLVALLFGHQADIAWKKGDVEDAHRYSEQAKKWNIAALVGGITSLVIACIFIGLVVAVSVAVQPQ